MADAVRKEDIGSQVRLKQLNPVCANIAKKTSFDCGRLTRVTSPARCSGVTLRNARRVESTLSRRQNKMTMESSIDRVGE